MDLTFLLLRMYTYIHACMQTYGVHTYIHTKVLSKIIWSCQIKSCLQARQGLQCTTYFGELWVSTGWTPRDMPGILRCFSLLHFHHCVSIRIPACALSEYATASRLVHLHCKPGPQFTVLLELWWDAKSQRAILDRYIVGRISPCELKSHS